jgi:hypothetical protein
VKEKRSRREREGEWIGGRKEEKKGTMRDGLKGG